MATSARSDPPKPLLDADAYTVGIVCALDREVIAVQSSFDHFFLDKKQWPKAVKGDNNSYSFGTILGYHVVVANLADMGELEATEVAKDMYRSFQNIKLCLVVGVCGIVPNIGEDETRLGDVIICNEVVHYTRGKDYPTGFHGQNMLHKASDTVLRGFKKLATPEPWEFFCNEVHKHLYTLIQHKTIKSRSFKYPGHKADILYNTEYTHQHHDGECVDCASMKYCQDAVDASCQELDCSERELVSRQRVRKIGEPSTSIATASDEEATFSSIVGPTMLPRIFLGKIASGHKVMKNGAERDRVANEQDVVAFEMEGAGVWSVFPTVVIKAGCDYADSHKNKMWQDWAAMTAASCAKAFLGQLQMGIPENVEYAVEDTEASASVWYVPFDTIPGFVGRKSELEELKRKLLNREGRRIVSILGLGGLGKSRLALELASYIKSNHTEHLILWVQASNQLTFERDLHMIGKQLQIPGIEDEKADVKALVKERLSTWTGSEWILVLDGADDEVLWGRSSDSFQQPISLASALPKTTRGSILITTRTQRVASFLAMENVLNLGPISQSEAVNLLLWNLQSKESGFNEDSLLKLVNYMECLPLAIVQAAAFINMNPQVTVQDYVELLNQSQSDAIQLFSQDFGDLSRYSDASNSIAATWLVSFEHILKNHPLAATFLCRMACFHEKNVPVSLLSEEDMSKLDIVMAIGVLTGYSFLKKQSVHLEISDGEELYNMHRLVQLAIRNWLTIKDELSTWMKSCLLSLADRFPIPEHANKRVWTLYLPHAQRLCEGINGLDLPEHYSLLYKLGRCYIFYGMVDQAIETCTLAATWREDKLGLSDERTLWAYNHLGKAHLLMRNHAQATDFLGHALHGYRKLSSSQEDPELLFEITSNLTLTFCDLGKVKETEELGVKLVETTSRVLGAEHRLTLYSMGTLAMIYQRLEQWTKAEEFGAKALEVQRRLQVAEHPDTIFLMEVVALTYKGQGQLARAQELFENTIELKKKEIGAEHPLTLLSMTHLIVIHLDQDRLKLAEELALQVMETTKRVLGAENLQTLASMSALCAAYHYQGKLASAQGLQEDIVRKTERILGAEHPQTLDMINDLASTLRESGQLSEAEERGVQVMEIRKRLLGEEHPDTLKSMHQLALTYRSQQRNDDAVTLMKTCAALRLKVLGSSHSRTINSLDTKNRWRQEDDGPYMPGSWID